MSFVYVEASNLLISQDTGVLNRDSMNKDSAGLNS